MWTARPSSHGIPGTQRLELLLDAKPASYADVVEAWCSDRTFCEWFSDSLASSPFSAFRWETPPVTRGTLDRKFEFVLLDDPGLARDPDPSAFAEHISRPSSDIMTFSNLSGDAVMVVPRSIGVWSTYGHIGAFVRTAPASQRGDLWRAVGAAMRMRVGGRPVWLSTAGAGVPWLHVRLDDRPKYYRFEADRSLT